MFSVPYDYSGIPVEEVLTGFQVTAPGATVDTASVVQEAIQPTLAVWDPLLGSYLITPALDKNSANLNAGQLALGQGYWGGSRTSRRAIPHARPACCNRGRRRRA